jgi:signal transduction histidine kinase
MKPMTFWPRFAVRWQQALGAALACAIVLLAAGAIMAGYEDSLYKQQQIKEIDTQAQILAASVTAALSFGDNEAAQEYVNALSANPDLEAAAVYAAQGTQVAKYARGDEPPPRAPEVRGARYGDTGLSVVVPVVESGQSLGTVYVEASTEPAARRFLRYSGIVLLAVMAALIVVVLGIAQAALRRANAELERRADALAGANAQLLNEMEERAKAEAALRQSQKMEAIGRLTGGIAHDFNNLLMIVSGYAQVLKMKLSEPKMVQAVDAIHSAATRGEKLTRQLLSFARRQQLNPTVVDLRERMEAVKSMLSGSLAGEITFHSDVQPDVWPVNVDPAELELAVLNVAINAKDAMPNGGTISCVVRNVTLDADTAVNGVMGDMVAIAVSDTGTGIAPEVVSQIFDPFFTTKPVDKGTGLGLAQVYGFTHQSGGTVAASSELGKGTTLTLYLPKAAGYAISAAEAESPTPGLAYESVLVVEDNPDVAEVTKTLLTQLGYRVIPAANADEALRELERGIRVEAMFSDIVMPGQMNGLALAQEVQKRYPRVKILLTSGYNDIAKTAEQQFAILRKPYQLAALEKALRVAIEGVR